MIYENTKIGTKGDLIPEFKLKKQRILVFECVAFLLKWQESAVCRKFYQYKN
ncbi:hypothetical protein FD12_GL001743 [Lentilactobacillus rapi DSM 19907 = JCM 15042]|uniref:Uncharacterized protein n=1 Tax=Lentilactobacillus rapi DSM 19907 = JCM 15042 TaxID=1423795 RepID=A0ABR5PFV3_9LACO|nr:hypothetical protein FD12_GL001743 [Lentilactobacillus rapi DSM 19907 = JCM 15042]